MTLRSLSYVYIDFQFPSKLRNIVMDMVASNYMFSWKDAAMGRNQLFSLFGAGASPGEAGQTATQGVLPSSLHV